MGVVYSLNIQYTKLKNSYYLISGWGIEWSLPTDSRTLMKTPRDSKAGQIQIGDMWVFHMDVADELRKHLPNPTPSELRLQLNLDGAPLYNCNSKSLWPLLCALGDKDKPKGKPFPLLLAVGSCKPNDCEFVRRAIHELNTLQNQGLTLPGGRVIPVQVESIVCDSPGRALIKGTKNHNARVACHFCTLRGYYHRRTMIFPFSELIRNRHHIPRPLPRTDLSFRNRDDAEFHKEDSVLLEFDTFDLVHSTPSDYMHLVCIGVMKRLNQAWAKPSNFPGERRRVLSVQNRQLVSSRLSASAPFLSSEFTRRPTSLAQEAKWKAHEYR